MWRARLRVLVTARWCLEVSPVYFRGRILPVSVTQRLNMCGVVKGISGGVRLRGFVSGVVMERQKGGAQKGGARARVVNLHFPAQAHVRAGVVQAAIPGVQALTPLASSAIAFPAFSTIFFSASLDMGLCRQPTTFG